MRVGGKEREEREEEMREEKTETQKKEKEGEKFLLIQNEYCQDKMSFYFKLN